MNERYVFSFLGPADCNQSFGPKSQTNGANKKG